MELKDLGDPQYIALETFRKAARAWLRLWGL